MSFLKNLKKNSKSNEESLPNLNLTNGTQTNESYPKEGFYKIMKSKSGLLAHDLLGNISFVYCKKEKYRSINYVVIVDSLFDKIIYSKMFPTRNPDWIDNNFLTRSIEKKDIGIHIQKVLDGKHKYNILNIFSNIFNVDLYKFYNIERQLTIEEKLDLITKKLEKIK